MTENNSILYVDDEIDIIYIVEFILQNGGFDIKTLNDSTLAIDELHSNGYSLVILDLMMPKMTGFQVVEKIREFDNYKKLPVLILSSKQLSNDETEFLKKMEANVMAKPFEPSRLLEKVRELIS